MYRNQRLFNKWKGNQKSDGKRERNRCGYKYRGSYSRFLGRIKIRIYLRIIFPSFMCKNQSTKNTCQPFMRKILKIRSLNKGIKKEGITMLEVISVKNTKKNWQRKECRKLSLKNNQEMIRTAKRQ